MSRDMIVSIHHYELAESTTDQDFDDAIQEAERRALFDLPRLTDYQFLRGVKGSRKDGYTALWMYEDQQAWRDLWGPIHDPIPPEEYPDKWKAWEQELLTPIISGNPDDIDYTSYETVSSKVR